MEKRRRTIGHSLLVGLALLAGCSRGGDARSELAYGVVRDEIPSRIVVIDDDGKNARRISSAERGSFSVLPDWSPDGTKIAFVRYSVVGGTTAFHVYVVKPDGSGERRVAQGTGPRWTSDGRFLVIERSRLAPKKSEIYVVSPDGSSARRLTVGSSPVPSHRGTRIAFVRYTYRKDSDGECCTVVGSALYTISLDGTGLRRLASTTGAAAHFVLPAWLPDDSAVSVVARTNDQQVAGKLYRVSQDGKRVLLAPGVGESYDWSPDGDRLAYTYAGSLNIVRPDGTRITAFGGVDALDLRWSPDGRKIAYSANEDPSTGKVVGIYVLDADDGKRRRIVVEAGYTAYLDWRPEPQS